MSLGTCSNEMLGQFVNSAVVFWKTKTKTVAGRLLKHLIFYSTKLILNNLFSLSKGTFLEEMTEV